MYILLFPALAWGGCLTFICEFAKWFCLKIGYLKLNKSNLTYANFFKNKLNEIKNRIIYIYSHAHMYKSIHLDIYTYMYIDMSIIKNSKIVNNIIIKNKFLLKNQK